MTVFYDIIDKIRDLLIADNDVNTVTYGRFDETALNKHTSYSLSHFVVNDVTYQKTLLISFSLYCMDIINQVSEDLAPTSTGEDFDRVDNLHDVLNTQLAVATRLMEQLRRGDVRDDKYHLEGNPTMIPFQERFEDDVAGWEVTFTIEIPADMTIC
jgi:hypothetical protein